MDPISLALTRWVTLVSRLAALSLSLHRGYRSARNGVVGFASLCGTISRALANLSSRFARFGSLELQDILLLWAVLRTLRGFVHRLFGRLGLGFFALPALPAWLRQLGAALAAPPALPSAAPSFGLPSAPGARSALLSASSWSGYPSALPAWSSSALAPAPPAYQPWPLAGGQRLALPPHFQRHGLPAGHRRPAPGSAQAEFLSGLSLASAAASSAPLPALPSVWSSASAPGLPAPPAHLPWPGYPVFGPPAPVSAPPAAPSCSRLPAWSRAVLGTLSSALPSGHLSGPAPRAPYAPMDVPLAPAPRSVASSLARPSGAPSSSAPSSISASGVSSSAPRPGVPSAAPLPVFGAPAPAPPSAASLGAFTFVPPASAPILPAGVPAPPPHLLGRRVGQQGQIQKFKRGSDGRRRRRRRR
ncbi:hypothetical protein SMACR_08202 [Sordaria macrospora]|uniref:Uncharacterized protein n=1 Tax=Sordaria macrospora TaxID=5147 RepID=A0A8S8ZEK3_SORMA|nr:hypothetical protein SMACR_08202 [Sordaria macrospora]WPJ61115.1 hypothetical protein SMAC4_08202 [Sordaria macrospora]